MKVLSHSHAKYNGKPWISINAVILCLYQLRGLKNWKASSHQIAKVHLRFCYSCNFYVSSYKKHIAAFEVICSMVEYHRKFYKIVATIYVAHTDLAIANCQDCDSLLYRPIGWLPVASCRSMMD